MPDPQLTREWTPIVSKHTNPDTGKEVFNAGRDERNREAEILFGPEGGPSREYGPSMEGGPDELARATKVVMVDGVPTIVPDDEFAGRAAEHQARNAAAKKVGLKADAVSVADRQALIDELEQTNLTEPEPAVADTDEATLVRAGEEEPEPDDTADSTEAEVREMFGESEEADKPK